MLSVGRDRFHQRAAAYRAMRIGLAQAAMVSTSLAVRDRITAIPRRTAGEIGHTSTGLMVIAT